ncbi:MAG TPA: hypothetical protein PLZ43_15950 [bacterium]|nr:hypothetical protein [bacterium]
MKKLMCLFMTPLFATITLLLSATLMMPGCEAADNFDSRVACHEYCSKNFDCNDKDPSLAETDDCVDSCRNSIEDNCGNEHQAAANDQIEECADKSCVDFWLCMHFDIAPECFGFVSN